MAHSQALLSKISNKLHPRVDRSKRSLVSWCILYTDLSLHSRPGALSMQQLDVAFQAFPVFDEPFHLFLDPSDRFSLQHDFVDLSNSKGLQKRSSTAVRLLLSSGLHFIYLFLNSFPFNPSGAWREFARKFAITFGVAVRFLNTKQNRSRNLGQDIFFWECPHQKLEASSNIIWLFHT